jgi:EAL domain-containing protein (putative c-di-GMP-specific phosphodiesterase class I)
MLSQSHLEARMNASNRNGSNRVRHVPPGSSAGIAAPAIEAIGLGDASGDRPLQRLGVPQAELLEGLSRALANDQFRLEYQPQVAADDHALLGVEALLRWDHPELGAISPAVFIPLVEQHGLIVPIGSWVLRTACRQLSDWDAQGLPPITMSVNVSPEQLHAPGFVKVVRDALAEGSFSPERLELEITEAEILHPKVQVGIDVLHELRDLGVAIALDDFGTGFSSLARLLHLPVDRLKIDRSFVTQLGHEEDHRAAAISSAIIVMGHALGLTMVAEGVETPAQRDVLVQQGCRVIQGYLSDCPMSAAEIVRSWQARSSTNLARYRLEIYD